MKKKLLLLTICFFANFFATAQKQIGYVRTVERPKQASVGIEGATVSIKEKGDIISNKNGYFDFPIKDKKEGESFTVIRVQKQGYTLIDKQLTGRKYPYSTTVPLEIVMVSDKQLARDKKEIEDKAFDRARKTYESQIAQLKQQLKEETISEPEYNKECERLSNDYDKYISLIGEMAERYAMTDYKSLSEINREIMQCIENAELERADSLINIKGNFDQREKELRSQMEINQATAEFLAQSQKDAEFKLNDLAQDYYNKFTIFFSNYQNDTAAYYLERRAALDTTIIDWQYEAGDFIKQYLSNYPLALKYLQRCLQRAQELYGNDSHKSGSLYNSIGLLYNDMGDYDKAIELFSKALDIEIALSQEQNSIAMSYSNIGNAYGKKGCDDKALECFLKALDIYEQTVDKDDFFTSSLYINIGLSYFAQGNYDKALEYYFKALEKKKEMEPSINALLYNNIGIVYSDQSDYDNALLYFYKALEIVEGDSYQGRPLPFLTYQNIGIIQEIQGQHDKALENYIKAIDNCKKEYGENNPNLFALYYNIACFFKNQGDYYKALEYFTKAVEFVGERFDPEDQISRAARREIEVLQLLLGQ